MSYTTDFPIVKPEVVFIEDLLEEIAQGRLRVPRFQRPFIWNPSDMIALYDSIYNGYPIGSLLIWESSEHVETLDKIGPIKCPESHILPISLILDGHQRLATLFGSLRLDKNAPLGNLQKDWRWWIWFDLKEKKFVHVKKDDAKQWFLPLRSVLKTVDFLEASRKLQEKHSSNEASIFIEEAEHLAQKIKNYKIAVIRIKGGNLEQAVTIFSRLNRRGQAITPDQMVSALTYREGENRTDLAKRIDDILEKLSDYHFGRVKRLTILRAILAAAGKDIHKSDWEDLSKKLGNDLPEAADIAEESLTEAARFLYEEIGVPSDRLLPYTHQILMLSDFFHHCPKPDEDQKEILKRWFWTTSLSGWFAGKAVSDVNNALNDMRELIKNDKNIEKLVPLETARPFPISFDMRSARIRALLIFLISLKPSDPDTSNPIDPTKLLSIDEKQYLPYIFPGVAGNSLSNPANRIFLERKAGKSVRERLRSIKPDKLETVLDSHGISIEAYELLKQDNSEEFIKKRAEHIAKLERDFMTQYDIKQPEDNFGETDIDTDDN